MKQNGVPAWQIELKKMLKDVGKTSKEGSNNDNRKFPR